MEQETKHKSKRALAIAGIATLSAFALIGLFAIGALIGGCAEKKQADATASEQVQTARHLDRVDAGVAVDQEPVDYLDGATPYHVAVDLNNDFYTFSYNQYVTDYYLQLPVGYYRLSLVNGTLIRNWALASAVNSAFQENAHLVERTHATASVDASGLSESILAESDDFNLGSSVYFYVSDASLFTRLHTWTSDITMRLELVDTLQVPASEVLTLSEDWNPTAWVSREAIGGYPVIHTTYATEANAREAYVLVGWNDVVFKTAADSVVFTGLRVRYRWLWSGAKYLYNGQTYTYSWPSGSGNYWLWPNAVEYRDVSGNWSVVASANQDWDGSNYIVTTRFNWVLPTYRALGFVEHPVNPDHLSVRRYFSGDLSTSEDDWVLSPILHGVSFAEWFGLASWDSPANDVGAGNAIGLISTAFTGMVPILGISIFPNITLGLLLFLPLIGGIIVLIIKAVSK